jgi:hypothetical protein
MLTSMVNRLEMPILQAMGTPMPSKIRKDKTRIRTSIGCL